ncbi:hypothetical protein [Deinococcus knuensis]|uniref:Lipoprotein n=1 Tax=Deinococcus knuensis TaxID=1837380 RepID=A0ABQ2SUY5_9DEIO|nr:hypothetical protein [Deinococcus knuensis]GGS37561.1 hypothetical protein GCM10008961_31410 [Deinococcus knuensis]
MRSFILALLVTLSGCASARSGLLGQPYIPGNTLKSSFCRAAHCPDVKPVLNGDKFADASELFRVYTYPLNLSGGIILAELLARVRPDGQLDVLNFEFLVPIRQGIQVAGPILTDWLRLAGLPVTAAQPCLRVLDRSSHATLTNLPDHVLGSCTAENGRPGYRIIRFTVTLKDTL